MKQRRLKPVLGLLVATAIMLSLPMHSVMAADGKTSAAQKNQTTPKDQAGAATDARVAGTDTNAGGQYVSIDFNDVDINVFIKFVSELTGTNFIVDPRVKGKITIISPSKISIAEAYKVFESVLDVHGYATVRAGEVTKIIPSPYARTMNIETRYKKKGGSAEDRIVTQLIHLRYADPNDVKQLFAPLVSKSSVILSYQPTNMLVITDVYSNIKRLMGIINAIDVTGIGRELSVLSLNYADAEEMSRIITSIFTARKRGKKSGQQDITIVPDTRTNVMVVMASEANTERVRQLVGLLDKKIPKGKENIHVYYLENAKAEDIVSVLQALPSKGSKTVKGKKVAPVVSANVKISADKATNALIVQASKDDFDTLKDVIQKLDIPRPMVYIECLIMEVSRDKSFNLGAEWIAGGQGAFQGKSGVYGGGFSGGALGGDRGYSYTVPSATGALTLPPGFSLGVFGENITVGGVPFPSISAVIQAYKKDNDAHILSTPQILTTDNETAKIQIGENIPYLTQSSPANTAYGNSGYNNYEYKDVGINLEITPQINKDRNIRLEISEEISKLKGTTDQFQPTTLKRSIKTTVIVKDGHTVVLGGLIDQSLSSTEYKVPCLGSIPVLGWLFKTVGKGDQKTNLFIFLTPRVLEGDDEPSKFCEEKRKEIETISKKSIKLYGQPDKEKPSK
ncbi:MAG: type II secretion system secretin GspD [Deltaproteobacteria bacterium]|nr:type II secretion system secretin GspD [Deltaproteobacteria bacterium]